MSTSQNNGDDTPTPPNSTTVVLLFGTLADTTWRMFVPTLGLTFGGVYLDRIIGTKPLLTIVGIVLGCIIAGYLIKRQFRKVNS